jgi:hypothetical protein
MSGFALEKRVRILVPLVERIKDRGVMYAHSPDRRWPWHVRPDDWPGGDLGRGIAFAENEPALESEGEDED